MMSQPNWTHLDKPELGVMVGLSQQLRNMEQRYRDLLPDLRKGSTLVIVSDFSGLHAKASYEVLTILLADLEDCGRWEQSRRELRHRFLPDGRRMAFKSLNDAQRRRALPHFLEAADKIPGLCVTLAIDRRIRTMFEGEQSEIDPARYGVWPRQVFERAMRAIHFVSFFVAGLSRPGQDMLWFADEDDIAANAERLTHLTRLAGNVTSHYLPHMLRHIRCGTTASDTGSRDIEDLAAIPDLVGGAWAEMLSALGPVREVLVPVSLSPKTIRIAAWLSRM